MTTACLDWADRLRSGRSIIPPPLFPEVAEQALEIFKSLRMVDAPGSPTFGEVCAEWVFDIVRSVFGAYDPSSGRRLITEWFILLPKKNGKSTIAAGIMMTALILNWRASGSFTIVAPTVQIAGNSFDPSRDMCSENADPELAALTHVQAHTKTITHRVNGGSLKVLAADSNTVGGAKSIGTLVDELWLFGSMSSAANMLREAIGGLASRPEGFVIYLTTQSDDPPAGVFKQKLDYARGVRDGRIIDPKFVPVIYEFPPEMIAAGEHRKPENFRMVNPNWGRSVDGEFIEREYAKAQEAGEAEVCGFLAKHGNVEIGLALMSNRWSGADYWPAQAKNGLTLDWLLSRCEVVDVGIDGGGLDDLFGLCVLGRDRETGDWYAWCHAWAHPSVLERRKSEAPRLHDFNREGDLTLVERIGDDVTEVAAIVARIESAGLLDRVGIDPNGIGSLLDALEESGIPKEKIVAVSQGWKLGGAIETAGRRLAEGSLYHAGTSLMSWCVGNAKVEPRGNAIVITKQASGRAKIDPLMAMFNAVSLMMLNPEGQANLSDFFRNPVIG